MKVIYPYFGRGRILKKEQLAAVRDYAFNLYAAAFHDFSDGIISGCTVSADSEEITITPGIIKSNNFIYSFKEPLSIPYGSAENGVALKMKFLPPVRTPDCETFTGELILDENLERSKNEVEICRFKLQKGSQLRSAYTNFEDIETEYDTVNLAHATWSSPGGESLSPVITASYARAAMTYSLENPWDISFCMLCMNSHTAIQKETICAYIESRLVEETTGMDNKDIFRSLASSLKRLACNE